MMRTRLLRCVLLLAALCLPVHLPMSAPARAAASAPPPTPDPARAKPLARQWALLIGIGQYQDASIAPLSGPPHDVAALREVLLARWGFPAAQVRTMQASQATRSAILQALRELLANSAPGDDILIYYSGHGTSLHDSASHLPMPHDTGALVPWDYRKASLDPAKLIVGRTDLRPLLEQLEAGKRKVWLVADACYSGQLVRNVGDERNPHDLPPRLLTHEAGQLAQRSVAENASATAKPISPWPYRKVQLLAAASAGTRAVEIPATQLASTPTRDGKPHGALTDALLRILHGELPADFDGDGYLSLDEVQRASAEFMDRRPYNHSAQRLPLVWEDAQGLGQQPVLRAVGVAAKPAGGPEPSLRVRIDSAQPAFDRVVGGLPHLQLVDRGAEAELLLVQNGPYWLLKSGHGAVLGQVDSQQAEAVDTLRGQLLQQALVAHIGGLARQYRHSALPVELGPPGSAGRVVLGSHIQYVLRPVRKAVLVVFDIDAHGKISVPFPGNGAQMFPREGGKMVHIPDGNEVDYFTVGKPTGLDYQLHFAFDAVPGGLAALCGQEGLEADDKQVRVFVNGLAKMRGRFGFAQTVLRVEP
jgi:hypothetical protein